MRAALLPPFIAAMPDARSASEPPREISTVDALRRLSQYVRVGELRGLIAAYIAMVVVVYPLDKVAVPVLVSSYIVAWVTASSTTTRNAVLGTASVSQLRGACIRFVALLALIWLLWSGLYYVGLHLQHRLSVQIKENIVREALHTYKLKVAPPPLGKWLNHLENVPWIMEQVVLKVLSYLFPELMGILVVTLYFFYVDWVLGLLTMIFIGVSSAWFWRFIRGSQRLARNEYAYKGEYHQRALNLLDNMEYVQTSDSIPFEMGRVRRDGQTLLALKNAFGDRNTVFTSSMSLLLIVFLVAFVTRCYFRMVDARTTSAQLALYGSVFVVLLVELKDLDYAKYIVTEFFNYTYKTSEFFEDEARDRVVAAAAPPPPPPPDDQEGRRDLDHQAGPPPSDRAAVEVRCLDFAHPEASARGGAQPRLTLRCTTMRVPRKGLHALVGPSGCGKSTLAKVLAGVYRVPPRGGRILVDGDDLTVDPDERMRRVAYLPQRVKLFEGSILDNIRYTHTHLRERDVARLMRRLGVEHVFTTALREEDTGRLSTSTTSTYLRRSVGTSGSKLSGGQTQLVVLLRLYVQVRLAQRQQTTTCTSSQRSVLILDEPTASLNQGAVVSALRIMRDLARTHTVLMITHDRDLARACDTQLKLASSDAPIQKEVAAK